MDFTIYSIGETIFLYEVLMGLRHMFDFGFSQLHVLIGTAALISLMVLVVKGWIDPNSNPILSWFIGLVMFMILCGPMSKVDVTIESVRTGEVYHVQDAPGIAAIAAIMTSGMYGLATDYEDSFGTSMGYRAGQFLDPMRALVSLERLGYATSEEEVAGLDKAKYQVNRSIQNYLIDCVMWDLRTGGAAAEITADNIKNSTMAELWPNLRVNAARITPIKLNSPDFDMLTCPVAYTRIGNFLDTSLPKLLANEAAKGNYTNSDIVSGVDTLTAGMASISAYKMAEGRYLSNKLAQVMHEMDNDIGLRAELTMIETRSQRHYQMTSDRSLTMEMAIGFATFLEAFVFFLIPLIAIILVMGAESMKSAAMFFGVSIWVNLWPVTMSAINLFTLLAIEGSFSSVMAGGGSTGALTFGMYANSMATIESYLSVASALAAAVPMITLYILHRGVHTMMGVSNKTTPDTQIDTQKMSPDLVANKGGGKVEQSNVVHQSEGTPTNLNQRTGNVDTSVSSAPGETSAMLKQGNAGLVSAASSGSSVTATNKATEGFNKTTQDSNTRVADALESYKKTGAIDSSKLAQLSEGEAYQLAQSKALMDEHSMGVKEAMDATAIIGGEVAASGAVGYGSGSTGKQPGAKGSAQMSAGVKANLAAKASYLSDKSDTTKFSDQQRADISDTLQANHAEAMKVTNGTSNDTVLSNKDGFTRNDSVAQSFAQIQELARGTNDAATASRMLQLTAPVSAGEVQNSKAGVDRNTMKPITGGLSPEQTYLALSQLPESDVQAAMQSYDSTRTPENQVSGKPLHSLSNEELTDVFAGVLENAYDKSMGNIMRSEDGAQLPQHSKNNIAAANAVYDVVGGVLANGSLTETDRNGNKVPLSSPVAAMKQSNNERGLVGNLLEGLGSSLGSGSLLNAADELKGSAITPLATSTSPVPQDKTGIDDKKLSKATTEKLEASVPKGNYDPEQARALHDSQKGIVKEQGNAGQEAVTAQAKPVISAVDSANMHNLAPAFEAMNFFGGSLTPLVSTLAQDSMRMFADSVGENVVDGMNLKGGGMGAAGEMVKDGYNMLANNTPEAIKDLLTSAANDEGALFEGVKLSPEQTKMKAGAVVAAMNPEAQKAFEESKNSPEGQKYASSPDNPYHRASESMAAVRSLLGNNESVKNDAETYALVAQYAALTGLDAGGQKDVFDALNGKESFWNSTNSNYGQHLQNLDSLAKANGIESNYANPKYDTSATKGGDLKHAILNGDFDTGSKDIAQLALQKLEETGSTAGINSQDLANLNRQTMYQTREGSAGGTTLSESTIGDVVMMADAFDAAGMVDEADTLRSSIQTLKSENLDNYGYKKSDVAQDNFDNLGALLDHSGFDKGTRDFARSVLHGNDAEPPQLGPENAPAVVALTQAMEGRGLISESYKVKTAFTEQNPSSSKAEATNNAPQQTTNASGNTDAPQQANTPANTVAVNQDAPQQANAPAMNTDNGTVAPTNNVGSEGNTPDNTVPVNQDAAQQANTPISGEQAPEQSVAAQSSVSQDTSTPEAAMPVTGSSEPVKQEALNSTENEQQVKQVMDDSTSDPSVKTLASTILSMNLGDISNGLTDDQKLDLEDLADQLESNNMISESMQIKAALGK